MAIGHAAQATVHEDTRRVRVPSEPAAGHDGTRAPRFPARAPAPDDGSPPLRILHVAEAFGGGLYEMVRAVANGAADAGHTVSIVYGQRPETPASPNDGFRPGVSVEALRWGGRSPAEQLRVIPRLRAAAREFEPDVVHLHSSFAGVVGAVALRGIAPVIYTPHAFASLLPGGVLRQRGMRAGERLAARSAAVVGAVSESEAACARERGALRTIVIRNGIPELDAASLTVGGTSARPAPLRPARVIAGGRIVRQRRPDACAAILGAVAEFAQVAWVGGGGEETPWTRAAREQLREAGAEPTGWVGRERWLSELERARVYVHWTSCDGLPLSVLEALASDTIVVASDIPPNREILGGEQVCATQEEAIALVERILVDDALASRLLEAQRERRRHFSAHAMVAAWLDVYGTVAPQHQPA